MCYADPGPRCSNHAKKLLVKAEDDYDNAMKNGTELEKHDAYAKLQEATDVFYMTPAGHKMLREKIEATNDPAEKQSLQDKLDYGIMAREYALEDIKAKDAGDVMTLKETAEAQKATEAEQIALDEAHAEQVQKDKDTLESFNIDRKKRGLMALSSVNSIALDRPQSGYASYDNSLIPQASDLEKVSSVVDAINNGATTATALGESFGITDREGSYYGNGAEYVGLVSKHEMDDGTNEFMLTENGRLFQQASSSDRVEMLKELVNATPIMKSYHENGRDKSKLENTIAEAGYSPGVAQRRASSMISWDKKLNSDSFRKTLHESTASTNKLSVIAAGNQKLATEERRSKLLKTNVDRDYGVCSKHFTALPANGICSECE